MSNTTFQDAFETFNEILEELGQEPISENTARNDFGIIGGETDAELYEWARDYASEIHTEICASKNAWRYEY